MSFSILVLYLSLLIINSKNLFSLRSNPILKNIQNNNQALAVNNGNELNYLDILLDVFKGYYKDCYEDLLKLDPTKYNMTVTSNYPSLFNHIGLTINDIKDEIECVKALNDTFFMIATIKDQDFINKDDEILLRFLDLHQLTVSACSTDDCKEFFVKFASLFAGFNNKDINKKGTISNMRIYPKDEEEEKEYKKENTTFTIIFYCYIGYIIIKFMAGIFRLIKEPKGYENLGNRLLQEKEKKLGINNEEKNEKSKQLKKVYKEYPNNYNPALDRSSEFNLWIRIWKFFDIFNDYSFLSTRRNKYFNDNGMEIINFLRVIALYFFIFSTTFTSLLAFPSKDILNKSFFSSSQLFFYKYSSNSGECWIFLEAAYASYKLMNFIKAKKEENNGKNNSKGYPIKLIGIYAKFILLFIPKIVMFIFCYFIFYFDLKKFNSFFTAKTTYNFIVETVITYNMTCSNEASFIFKHFNPFNNNATNFNRCYDFTYIDINILICILVFMFLIFITFIIQKILFELFFYLFFLVFFFGLMLIVDDQKRESVYYNYYHFKGQDYTTKIIFLAIGVYNLGFIFGILCFNYNILKHKWNKEFIKKNKESQNYDNSINNNNNISKDSISEGSFKKVKSYNSNNINFQIEFYPLSFMNGTLKWLHYLNSKLKILIIFICLALQLLISSFFKIYSDITKKYASEEQKNEPNFDRNYVLEMKFDWKLWLYFHFEKHLFLILFFIISINLITIPKTGIFKKFISSSLITTISRTGFIIICLSYIITNFSFCGFLIKIKFNIPTFIIISIGNFLIIFVVSLLFNITIELPIRIIVKKIVRIGQNYQKNVQENQLLNDNGNLSSKYRQK